MWYTEFNKGGIRMIALLLSHPIEWALLILGFALLVVEMCVPGFGVPGVLGIGLSVLALYRMGPPPALLLAIVGAYVLLLLIALIVWMRRLNGKGAFKSKLVLDAVSTRPAPADEAADLSRFAGRTGAAHTPLRPAGIAEIDGARLNVVTEGDYIEAGAPVKVERVEGNRVVVART